MKKNLGISFDSDLIEQLSADFDLRTPNKEALRKLIFTLDGEYDRNVIQVANLATGVGKTYLMAAFIEYLRMQGVGNVVIVTPGKTVQSKTVQNFVPGSSRYIPGSQMPPDVVTPQDYSAWVTRINSGGDISYGREVPILLFIFNIQQLIAPKSMDGDTHGSSQDSERRKPRRFDENAGVLFEYLKGLDDLVVIADESHLYSSSAVAFNAALKELEPAVTIGLTATIQSEDHVIYRYPLYKAIQDEYVKSPVLAYRKGGYGADQASEEQQLRDAMQLRAIKQEYYDAYTGSNELPHINAVLFVVCADVDHASQVTELLRGPAYFGKSLAVLQVDSKHDDETTLRLLEDIDGEDSPVLAVVSVNKLKEGWDVKNIAVVVTLRAMASEVLTQQTMGRGLRLPFGKYTKIRQIDQLDIIAHQSFEELLNAENVLESFGLEEAVDEKDKEKIKEDLRNSAGNRDENRNESDNHDAHSGENEEKSQTGNENESVGSDNEYGNEGNITDGKSHGDGDDNGSEEPGSDSNVSIRNLDNDAPDNLALDLKALTVEPNPDFEGVSYMFPVTTIELVQPPIDLSEISEKDIEDAAKRVTSTGDILYRKEIIAALGKKLRTVDTESAEVESVRIEDDEARDTLVRLVMNMPLVPATPTMKRYVQGFLIPKFMKQVSFDGWTVKSLSSARGQLLSLIKDYIAEVQRNTKEKPTIRPKKMSANGYMMRIGEIVYEQIDTRSQFEMGRVYAGWFKSLYEKESFDSYSGEYELARLLNTSPHIVWWHRLHETYDAYIYYTARDRYFPDFVALDDEGTHWIIEGKDKRGRFNDQVQKKRKAAETLVRKMATEEAYEGQHWGYLIAYEDDIEKSDSWDDLKTLAQPVTNIL